MAQANNVVRTQKAIDLTNSLLNNQDNITFTKIIFSSDDYLNLSIDDIRKLVDINNKELTIDAKTMQVDSVTEIEGYGENTNITTGFYIKTYALYAKGKDGNEFLFAIVSSNTNDYMPEFNGSNPNKLSFTFNLTFQDTNNITFSNLQDISVTQDDIKRVESKIDNIDLSPYEKSVDANSEHTRLDKKIDDIDLSPYETKQDANKSHDDLTTTIKNDIQPKLDNKIDKIEFNNKNNEITNNINSKQPLGDYVTKLDLENKLKSKQDIGSYLTTDEFKNYNLSTENGKLMYGDKPVLTQSLPSGIHLNLSFLYNVLNTPYYDIQYNISIDDTNGSDITGYTIYINNDSGYSTNISNNNNVGYIPDDVAKDSICNIYVTVHSTSGDINSETKKILIPTNLDDYISFDINTGSNMTQNYWANIINNKFQYFISKNIKLYAIQINNSISSVPDDFIQQSKSLPLHHQTYIDNYNSQLSDLMIRTLNDTSNTFINSSSGYYLNGQNGWRIVMYAELLDSYGNETNIFSKPKLY